MRSACPLLPPTLLPRLLPCPFTAHPAAALLHDALDRTLLVEAQLRPMLGDDRVAELVKQVAHLGDVSSKYRSCPATSPEGQAATASSLVGMLVAMGANHALLVKLADRLHDMRTLSALPAAKRNRLAQETVDVWAPLANRLGVWSLKAQLEDLAFKQLYPGQVSAAHCCMVFCCCRALVCM